MAARTHLAASLAAAALLAAPAAASADSCKKASARVLSGAAGITDWHKGAPEGEPLRGKRIKFPGHFYVLEDAAKLRIKGNTYEASAGSILKLTCYGKSRTDKKRFPAVDLLRGELEVKTSAKNPGGVVTEEGLFDPRSDPSMTYTVERTTTKRGDLGIDDMGPWFAGFANQPAGTTKVASATSADVGVTPYVGERKGSCRYVKGATLTTKGRYGNGSASYET